MAGHGREFKLTGSGTVSVSRRIAVPPKKVFEVLADPCLHPEIDGSGVLRAALTGRISSVGDVFFMSMNNEEMGDYEMQNRVVEFDPARRIGWEPALSRASRPEDQDGIGDFAHHAWIYDLADDGSGGTVVTEIYDCRRAPAWLRKAVRDGERWTQSMQLTLEKLDRVARG